MTIARQYSQSELSVGADGSRHRLIGNSKGFRGSFLFWSSKRVFDIFVAIIGLPIITGIALWLLLINPWVNPGRLFYTQKRMGRHGDVFMVWKFRTMRADPDAARGPDDPLERHRITPLGRWLRRTRIDELPQLWNVLKGDMSLVGPRPDLLEHARAYVELVPRYNDRHQVRPGLSGLAQVRMGYAEGLALTARKARLDMIYIRRASWRLEWMILRRTIAVILTGFGAH